MRKNTASQKWVVYAYGAAAHASPGDPITGDAANITANVRIDGAAANAVDDTNPTELEDGYYIFDITAAESNGDNIVICPASGTANVLVRGVPEAVWTTGVIDVDASGRVNVGKVFDTTQTTGTDIPTDLTAVKAKTDSLTFTVAGDVDANVQTINGAAVTGDGNATPWDGA